MAKRAWNIWPARFPSPLLERKRDRSPSAQLSVAFSFSLRVGCTRGGAGDPRTHPAVGKRLLARKQ